MLKKSIQFKSEDVNHSERIFTGYASTWDKDQGNDIIVKGAFAKTIQERGNNIKVLYQHDQHQPIGKAVTLEEDSKGLLVTAKISKTRLGDEVLELIKDDVINQMSIGFSIPNNKSEVKNDIRYIKEVKLFEFSPVTFPMNESAIITGVKSMREALALGQVAENEITEVKELLKDLTALFAEVKPQNKHLTNEQPQELQQLIDAIKTFKL